jgi:hypothetical protein
MTQQENTECAPFIFIRQYAWDNLKYKMESLFSSRDYRDIPASSFPKGEWGNYTVDESLFDARASEKWSSTSKSGDPISIEDSISKINSSLELLKIKEDYMRSVCENRKAELNESCEKWNSFRESSSTTSSRKENTEKDFLRAKMMGQLKIYKATKNTVLKIIAFRSNLLCLKLEIQQMQTTVDVIGVLDLGSKTLSALQNFIDVDKVGDMIENMNQSIENMKEVDDVVSSKYDKNDEEDTNLDKELEELIFVVNEENEYENKERLGEESRSSNTNASKTKSTVTTKSKKTISQELNG